MASVVVSTCRICLRLGTLDDEVRIALDLAAMLEEEGFEVYGPHHKIETALDAISENAPDAAILDVNLGSDVTSVAVAEALDHQSIPFAFLTGYEKSIGSSNPGFAIARGWESPSIARRLPPS